VKHFDDFPDGGGYPKRFLEWAFQMLRIREPQDVLHICSGSVLTGVRLDIRVEVQPDVVADALLLPFEDNSFNFALADPPYSKEYAKNLYGTEDRYPAPARVVSEAIRVLKPDGILGFLHFQVPMVYRPAVLKEVHGVSCGCGYALRAFSIIRKGGEYTNNLITKRSKT
jgi:hypothetical protein